MKLSKTKRSFTSLIQFTRDKLFKINDAPQKKALGLGIGVFSGILPGTGPLAALFLASLLRANKAMALLGSLLTNTWLSFATFFLAIKIGSGILNVEPQEIKEHWNLFLLDFHFTDLFSWSVMKIILPIVLGFSIVALCCGLGAYGVAFLLLSRKNYENKN